MAAFAVFTNLLFIVLAFQPVPNRVDGEHQFRLDLGRKSGDPVLTLNSEIVIRRGRGPGEIEPVNLDYDWRSQRVYLSDGYKILLYEIATKQLETIHQKKWTSHRGTWGTWQIVFHHDYMRDRTAGGRLFLEKGSDKVLLANYSAAHSNMHSLVFFARGKDALVILDNVARKIGYLPLADGKIAATNGKATSLLWFPMPADVRESIYHRERHTVHLNNYMLFGAQIHPGLFMLTDSQGSAYVYDLENTSSFYLGRFDFTGAIAGSNNGKVLVYNIDDNRIDTIDPLTLVSN